MKKPLLTLLIFFSYLSLIAQQQKIIADCTVTYAVNNSQQDLKNNSETAVKTIYISGKQIRIDLSSATFNQTIFYNDNTGEATVLKSIGESKYISAFTAADWQKRNDIYNGVKISFTNNIKKILNFECKEAVLQLANGNSYTLYYVPELRPSITENTYEFKNVPGLILQYQSSIKNQKINYTATSVNFDPVPDFKFEIPKAGYKIIND